jgi:hypothetical protein
MIVDDKKLLVHTDMEHRSYRSIDDQNWLVPNCEVKLVKPV